MDKIQKIIQTKFQQKKLAHFYLLNPSRVENSNFLEDWILKVFENFTTKEIQNHPDFLHIQSDDQKKIYKWEELSEIFNFLKYGAIEWHQKIIVISDAHKITDNISNKLLKVFEEPPTHCTFFLINPTKKKLLQTIESRAINLSVKIDKEEIFEKFDINTLKDLHLHDFINELKSKPELEDKITSELLNHCDYQLSSKLLEVSKLKKIDNTFHNSINYRLFKLHSALQLKMH